MVTTKLNSINFYARLANDSLNGPNYSTDFEIVIDDRHVDWHYRMVKNVVFEDIVRVSSVEINSGLTFIDCEFKKGIVFRNVTATNFNSTYNPNNSCVVFNNCTGSHIDFADGCNFERAIVLENNSKFDKLLVYDTQIGNGGLKLANCEIRKLVYVKRLKAELRLQYATISKDFTVESVNGDISSVFSKFGGFVRFWNVESPNSFTLNDNIFNGTFNIEGSRIKGFFIHGDEFNKKFELENRDVSGNNNESYCNHIYISEAKFIEGGEFNGLSKEIEKITLRLTPNFQGVVKFNGWKVDELHVSGVNQNLKLLFKNMVFRFVLLNDFTNFNDLSFDKCSARGDSPLHLSDCDLGGAKFNEFDFNSFSVISVDNATLDKIRVSSAKWFKDEALKIEIANQSNNEAFRRRREVYRQIKQALRNSGNQIDSLLFQAREMKAYRDELIESGKYSFEDRVIMTVSHTNKFGLSWLKPTWIIFLITFGFYLLMLPEFSDQINYCCATTWEEVILIFCQIWDNFNVFWQLFNPARRFSTVFGDNNSGLLQFLDLLHRLILGVFIFQIISGFRKLTSK